MTFIIATPMTMFVRVWRYSLLGNRLPWCTSGWKCGDPGSSYNRAPDLAGIGMAGAAGFAIVVALSLISARYTWFPLTPVGFLIRALRVRYGLGLGPAS